MMDYLIGKFPALASAYINILIELCLFFTAFVLSFWLKPFVKKLRAAYLASLLYWVMLASNNHLEVSRAVGKVMIVAFMILIVIIVWLLDDRRNPIQKIFLCMVFRVISWLSMEIFVEIGYFENELVEHFDWYRTSTKAIVIEYFIWNMIEYAMIPVLLYLALKVMHKAYRYKSEELSWRELIILLIPTWTVLLVKEIMASYLNLWMDGIKNGSIQENVRGDVFRFIFSILSFFTIVIALSLHQELKKQQEEEFIRRSVEGQINDTYRHVGHIEEMYEKMRAIRHDIGNHLTVIEGLAESGKNDELVEYIGELQDRFDGLQPSVKTGNAVTDVIISETFEKCREENIAFDSHFTYPTELDINPFDMSVVLTNALQNAIEACEVIKTGGTEISIKSVVRERFLIINVRNTVYKKAVMNDDGLPETSKGVSGHGYGLKNIRNIAQKYKGDIEIRQEESDGRFYFILNIMLMG